MLQGQWVISMYLEKLYYQRNYIKGLSKKCRQRGNEFGRNVRLQEEEVPTKGARKERRRVDYLTCKYIRGKKWNMKENFIAEKGQKREKHMKKEGQIEIKRI